MRIFLILCCFYISTISFAQKNALRLIMPLEAKNNFGLQYERSLSRHFSLNYSIRRITDDRSRRTKTIVPDSECGNFGFSFPCKDEHIFSFKQEGIRQTLDLRFYPKGRGLSGFFLESGLFFGTYKSATSAILHGWKKIDDVFQPFAFERFNDPDIEEFNLKGRSMSLGWNLGVGYQVSLFKHLNLGLNAGIRRQFQIQSAGDHDAIFSESLFKNRDHLVKGLAPYLRIQVGFQF